MVSATAPAACDVGRDPPRLVARTGNKTWRYPKRRGGFPKSETDSNHRPAATAATSAVPATGIRRSLRTGVRCRPLTLCLLGGRRLFITVPSRPELGLALQAWLFLIILMRGTGVRRGLFLILLMRNTGGFSTAMHRSPSATFPFAQTSGHTLVDRALSSETNASLISTPSAGWPRSLS